MASGTLFPKCRQPLKPGLMGKKAIWTFYTPVASLQQTGMSPWGFKYKCFWFWPASNSFWSLRLIFFLLVHVWTVELLFFGGLNTAAFRMCPGPILYLIRYKTILLPTLSRACFSMKILSLNPWFMIVWENILMSTEMLNGAFPQKECCCRPDAAVPVPCLSQTLTA